MVIRLGEIFCTINWNVITFFSSACNPIGDPTWNLYEQMNLIDSRNDVTEFDKKTLMPIWFLPMKLKASNLNNDGTCV